MHVIYRDVETSRALYKFLRHPIAAWVQTVNMLILCIKPFLEAAIPTFQAVGCCLWVWFVWCLTLLQVSKVIFLCQWVADTSCLIFNGYSEQSWYTYFQRLDYRPEESCLKRHVKPLHCEETSSEPCALGCWTAGTNPKSLQWAVAYRNWELEEVISCSWRNVQGLALARKWLVFNSAYVQSSARFLLDASLVRGSFTCLARTFPPPWNYVLHIIWKSVN